MVAGHSGRAHALLSASGASRWINCPPSARLQDGIADTRSVYADEGTLAHELSENKLARRLTVCDSKKRKQLDKELKKITSNDFYGPEMENAITEYCEIVEERAMEAKYRSEDAVVLLEERLDFSAWVPEGFGTGDVLLISDGICEVIDLKYGKGVPVSAIGNYQMRLYALGALNAYDFLYGITEVRMTIIQPRLDSISTDTMTTDELLSWAEEIVKPAAALADAGEGDYLAGEHCRWCKVKGNCRARADANMALLAHEFRDPALLSLDEIGSILTIAEQLQAWSKDVQGFAFDQAKAGHIVPGWKLVEGRSNRAIADKEAALKRLAEAIEIKVENYIKTDLRGITELEKNIGKKELATLLDGLIIKPPGKPVLVVETDKRPELNSVDGDFAGEDFGE